jgi:hypothetical protein
MGIAGPGVRTFQTGYTPSQAFGQFNLMIGKL